MGTSSTKYIRYRIRNTLSRSSDMSDPIHDIENICTSTCTKYIDPLEFLATTGGVTIDFSSVFTTITQIILELRAAGTVVVAFTSPSLTGTACSMQVVFPHPIATGSVSPGVPVVFTASSGSNIEVVARVFGT